MDIQTPMCYYIGVLCEFCRIVPPCGYTAFVRKSFTKKNKDLSEKIGVDYEGSQTLALL